MSENELAVMGGEVATVDVSKLKLVKRIVVPTISIKDMKEGDILYFRAESEIKLVDQIDEDTGEVKEEKLPTLHITKLNTMQFGQIVLGAVAYRGLKEEGELTGRLFAMQKGKKVGRTNLWDVVEVMEG